MTTIISEKVTGNFKLIAVEKTTDGHTTYGFGIAKRGARRYGMGWGYSEQQARRLVRKHYAAEHDADILYCG